MSDGVWRPEYHDGTGNFARGWFARRSFNGGSALLCEVTGGPLGLYPFADQAECQRWCDAKNADGGKDADSYKLNPGGQRA